MGLGEIYMDGSGPTLQVESILQKFSYPITYRTFQFLFMSKYHIGNNTKINVYFLRFYFRKKKNLL